MPFGELPFSLFRQCWPLKSLSWPENDLPAHLHATAVPGELNESFLTLVTCYSPLPLISMLIASQALCQAGLELWNKRPWQEPFHMEEGVVVAEGKGFSKAGYELIWPFCCVGLTKHTRDGRGCSVSGWVGSISSSLPLYQLSLSYLPFAIPLSISVCIGLFSGSAW